MTGGEVAASRAFGADPGYGVRDPLVLSFTIFCIILATAVSALTENLKLLTVEPDEVLEVENGALFQGPFA